MVCCDVPAHGGEEIVVVGGLERLAAVAVDYPHRDSSLREPLRIAASRWPEARARAGRVAAPRTARTRRRLAPAHRWRRRGRSPGAAGPGEACNARRPTGGRSRATPRGRAPA